MVAGSALTGLLPGAVTGQSDEVTGVTMPADTWVEGRWWRSGSSARSRSRGIGLLFAAPKVARGDFHGRHHDALAMIYVAWALFLGVVQVVVYTGAVMMLFLFVLMLDGVDSSSRSSRPIGTTGSAILAGPRLRHPAVRESAAGTTAVTGKPSPRWPVGGNVQDGPI